MIEYTHVRAKVDVYNQQNDLVCFAGEEYKVVGIDSAEEIYIIEVEPEIGGYARTIGLYLDDHDFYFLDTEMIVSETYDEEVIAEHLIIEEEW